MKDTKTYNGWSNYATWRIQLEIIDELNGLNGEELFFDDVASLADYLQEYVDDMLADSVGDMASSRLVLGYARAFVDDVNFLEIAHAMVENYPQVLKTD